MAFFDDCLISCARYDGYFCENTDMAVTPASAASVSGAGMKADRQAETKSRRIVDGG